ncbi:MAG: lysylphosphatidylglycerol synthase transmembrane domain-containing protein [Longimicrobiales bacterium]
MRKHWGKAVVGLAITVFFLWWALKDVAFSDVWAQIRRGDPWLLLAAVAVATFGFFIRALRWKVLLAPVQPDTGLRARFSAVSIGFMANNILPARAGEFARALALSRMEPGVSASAAFGTLVVERVMDGAVLLLLLLIPLLLPGFPASGVFDQGLGAVLLWGGLAFVGGVLAALVVMAAAPRQFVRLVEYGARFLPEGLARPLVAALESFLESVAIFRRPGLLTLAFAWTLVFWLWHGLSFYLAMLAFGIDAGLVAAYFTEAVVGFGVALPSAPGFVGTFHAAADFALSDVYGVDPATSLAFAFGYHFGGWVPITAIGLWYAWKLGLTLGEVGTAEERVEAVVEMNHPGADLPGS